MLTFGPEYASFGSGNTERDRHKFCLLLQGHRLRVFENRVLRGISGTKRENRELEKPA